MIRIASVSLIVALVCTGYTVIAAILGLKTHRAEWGRSAIHALEAISGLLTLAVCLLLYFLLQRDFRLEYVASYTEISLAPVYVISALWAGQKGSLLLWGWLLSLCSTLFVWRFQKNSMPGENDARVQDCDEFFSQSMYITLVFAGVLGFFLYLLVFKTPPFTLLSVAVFDGQGMNPILQNPYMVLHPPVLFIGYTGFVVPFAIAVAALCTGHIHRMWLISMRRWALFSWYFLGLGILLGAHWAYLELGWGGYWSWDPVENASFIPWLASTALLHTLILQQRKGVLKRWNIFLSMMIFFLCILATFITRSGILTSVHAYAESAVGMDFLIFLVAAFLATMSLFGYRWKRFQSKSAQTATLSKENSFFLVNQLLIGWGFAVLYGTIYPLLSARIFGKTMMIGPPFFNRVSIPISLIILGLLGLCQLFPWKRSALSASRWKYAIALGGMFLAALALFVSGIHHFSTLVTCSLGIFVAISTGLSLRKLSWPASAFHLGTVVICLGIAISSTYKLEKEVELSPGESTTLGNIRLQFVRLNSSEDAEKGRMVAEVAIYKNEEYVASVAPEKRFYGQTANAQVTTEIGLHTSLKDDIYVILEGWDEQHRTTFLFIFYPMILWIWIGGFVIFTLGMILAVIKQSSTG